MLAMEESH
jgi:hypothetical protein